MKKLIFLFTLAWWGVATAQTITATTDCDVSFRAVFQQTSPYNGSQFTRCVSAMAEVDPMDNYSFSFVSELDDYQQFINPGTLCYFDSYIQDFCGASTVPIPTLVESTNINLTFWEQSDVYWFYLDSASYSFTNICCWDWPNYNKESLSTEWHGGDVWCDFDSSGDPRITEGNKPTDFGKWTQDGSINPSWVEPLVVKGKKGHRK